MKTINLAIIVAVALVGEAAEAAEKNKPATEIIVNDGIAFSRTEGEKERKKVIAYDVVSAWQDSQPQVANCDKFSATLKGAKWCFATEVNKSAFLKATDKDGYNELLPFIGGRCALGASWGRIAAEGDPRTARIIQADLGPILVLQSAQKWWPMFEKHIFTRLQTAGMRFDFAKRVGDIVPNDKNE